MLVVRIVMTRYYQTITIKYCRENVMLCVGVCVYVCEYVVCICVSMCALL